MNHWIFAYFVAGLLVIVSGCASAESPAGVAPEAAAHRSVQRHGQLRVEGNRILDAHGEAVQLTGMSLFWSQWGGKYFTPEVVAWLADDWRCEVVRAAMGIGRGGYLENPEEEMAKVAAVIEAAVAQGIYVIVDWHAHEPEPDQAAAFFAEIAKTYGHLPNIIYETWNEPLKDHDWSTVIKPYHEQVVAAIREHDPDNLVLLGTQLWSMEVDKAAADPVAGENLAYVLHFYAGSHGQPLRDKAEAALAAGVALFVSEWGTSKATGDDGVFVAESQAWLDFLDQHQIGWCNWSVFDKQESSAALQPGASVRGEWAAEDLTESGRFLRTTLRKAAKQD